MLSEKVVIDPDRYKGYSFWRRFPGLNAVTLISTLDASKETKVSFQGMGMPFDEETPFFLLTCAADSPLYKNISQWGEFVVNFPGTDLVETLYFCALNFRNGLIQPDEIGLTSEPSQRIKTYRIQECYAHLECRLEREIYHHGYVMIVGRILAGYLDQKLVGNSGETNLSEEIKKNKLIGYLFPFGYSLIDHIDYIIDIP